MESFWEKLVYRWCKPWKKHPGWARILNAVHKRASLLILLKYDGGIKCFWTHSKAASNRKTMSQLINTNEQTCICVCVYIRIFIPTYAYTYTHIRLYLYAHTRIHIRTYAYYARFLVNVYLSGTENHADNKTNCLGNVLNWIVFVSTFGLQTTVAMGVAMLKYREWLQRNRFKATGFMQKIFYLTV